VLVNAGAVAGVNPSARSGCGPAPEDAQIVDLLTGHPIAANRRVLLRYAKGAARLPK